MTRKDFARVYGSPERVAWLQSLPCIACYATPSQVSHVKSGGVARKGDAQFTVPMCHACHQEYHQHGHTTFEGKYEIDLLAVAANVAAAWTKLHPEE